MWPLKIYMGIETHTKHIHTNTCMHTYKYTRSTRVFIQVHTWIRWFPHFMEPSYFSKRKAGGLEEDREMQSTDGEELSLEQGQQ